MDIIDNLIYANVASSLRNGVAVVPFPPAATALGGDRISSDYIDSFALTVAPTVAPTAGLLGMPDNAGSLADPIYTYDTADKMNFCAYPDPETIENSVLRHWHDINTQVNYDSDGVQVLNTATAVGENRYTSFEVSSTYHLIFAYLTENTRMLQIFERLLEKYLYDETFGIADNALAVNWLQNAERLFFKNDTMRSSSIRSLIRPNTDATRRNAYWRMFGMDLSFGDINSQSGGSIPYVKAKYSNQQFVPLFEKFLSEVWQAYINARNTSGANTSDIDIINALATDLQELLAARRGNLGLNTYANLNLSREEFSSVLITSWFTFIISDDTPLVQFLNCQSSTMGERLIKIGNKVGIPAHSKSQDLFEMAGAAANILRQVEEGGVFDDPATMTTILNSLTPPVPANATRDMNNMYDLLTVINYWEKATGHRIKNPESNIRGTVSIAQTQTQRSSSRLITSSLT